VENNMLKWYGNVLHVTDNRWPKRKFIWSVEGRKRRGRPDITWESEVAKVMKRNVILEEAVDQ
jgi:hypothetical protein